MIVGISLLLAVLGAALMLLGADALGAILLAIGLIGGLFGILIHARRRPGRPGAG